MTAVSIRVRPAAPRTDVYVSFPGVGTFSAPIGTPLRDYVAAAFPPDHPDWPVLGAIVDNQLTELTTPVQRDITAHPITLRHSDGGRMYRRSLVFLMTTAVGELFPGLKVAVEHSVPSGGFYCSPVGRPTFSAEELQRIKGRMLEIVAADEPFVRQTMNLGEAVAWFAAHGDLRMVRLLEAREKNYLTVYRLRGVLDYFFGYMVASTGCLRYFDLMPSGEGFILRYPRAESGVNLAPYTPSEKLEAVFRQNRRWQTVMGLEDIGALNRAILEGRFSEEVLIAEALHARFIDAIAEQIAMRHAEGVRLVLIAGPSSSGKTTFSKRLAIQLMAYGVGPFTLAMDNYFVPRHLTPRDEDGDYDFESLQALDLPRLNQDILALMSGANVELPKFNFVSGQREVGETAHLNNDNIIIAEGIHGLNPALLPSVPPDRVFRIYVSAVTALNLDLHNRVPTTDVRLLRRIVRDAAHRGYSAQNTLDRWESVRRGEKRNIFPYQENADVMFNSSLFYELAALRPFAEPLLRQVDPESPRYIEAKRLLSFLRWVRPAPAQVIPDNSLLREFIGGSILENYQPGKRRPNGSS
jgi:uridine kinase